MSPFFTIVKAGITEIEQVSQLFNRYRQFYQQKSDITLAKHYITEKIATKSSVILLASDRDKNALGFCQLYPSFCSIDVSSIFILYDLFVDIDARNNCVGTALMLKAKEHAIEAGASRLDLETAKTNKQAQKLYQALGYQRDNDYYKYSLEL